ncbi:MAG: hypothetical protein FWE20_00060 [Defluviitaleaceae bacterium]|nr:hypothetical protein [Defluviitaleaceae bacterium]
MKGFKTIPPKQKYMTFNEIHKEYGSRGVVAYSCKTAGSVPEGGFVIAVQDKAGADNSGIKEYQVQLLRKYPAKAPIYYLRVEAGEGANHFSVVYDNGSGERNCLSKIEIKKSRAEEAISFIPDEILAQAISSSFKSSGKPQRDSTD